MSRRWRRNRENRDNLFKRKLEDIERQEKEQKLRQEQRSQGISSPALTVGSSAATKRRSGNDERPRDLERTESFETKPPSRKSNGPSTTTRFERDTVEVVRRPPPPSAEASPSLSDTISTFAGRTNTQHSNNSKSSKRLEFSSDDNGDDSEEDFKIQSKRRKISSPSLPAAAKAAPPESKISAKLLPLVETKRPIPAPKDDVNSDSDDSFNMLAAFKEKKERLLVKSKETTNSPDAKSNASANTIARKAQPRIVDRKNESILSETEDSAHDHKKDEPDLSQTKTNGKMASKRLGDDHSASDDSDDHDVGRDRNGRRSVSSRKRHNRRQEYSSSEEDRGSETESEDDRKRSTRRPNRSTGKPRNPIALERDARDQFFATAKSDTPKSNTAPQDGDDTDGFMSDCEPAPTPEKPKKRTSAPKDKKKVGSSSRVGSKSRGSNTKSGQGKARSYDSNDTNSECDEPEHGESLSGSSDDLHPELVEPNFGPYEPMEPLVLSDDQSETTVQVPASFNRYLAPFQREGVRFLYNCLASKMGAILGDEMGCGKTVQVIALLCALFNKTGTRKDQADIRERNILVRKQKMVVQRSRDQALRMGEVLDEDTEGWKKNTLSLSPWNPVMIIVPPTIMDTWKSAFQKFSHFSVAYYYSKTRTKAIDDMLYGSADILLVPKSAFQNELHLAEFEKIQWKLIIIDEFHNFKNHKAKISLHLRKLKTLHHPLILGMTGTPMQNNHTELWNLVDLVETKYFGTQDEFKHNFDRPITLGRQKNADPRVQARSEAASALLRKELNKIYIKRNKNEVMKDFLPEKNEQMILCDLSPLQKEVYKVCVGLPDFDLVKHGSRPCDCGINRNFFRKLFKLKCKAERLEYLRTNKRQVKNQATCCRKIPVNPRFDEERTPPESSVDVNGEPYIDPDAVIWRTLDAHCTNETAANEGCERCPWCCTLPCLTKLNKLSSHLGLLQATKTIEPKGSPAYIRYIKEREFAKVSLAGVASRLPGADAPGGGYDRCDGIMNNHFSLSGKLRVLDRLLQKYYNEGGKVLLFAHSTQSLGLIENWLKSRGSFDYLRMDGSTPLSKRQQLCDEYNNDDRVFLFLLSIKATGLGLNLTSANRVVMFDVSWNPSWEIQAQDRAHRIGQKRDVRVVRLISRGTVEEMIYLRQIYKIHLKQDTLQDRDDEDAEAPRVFRGVQGDKYRKGEIFGTENLFRFKEEGSFLDDIWAESRGKQSGDSSGLEIHDSGELSKALLGMTDKDKEKVGEEDEMTAIEKLSRKVLDKSPPKTNKSSMKSYVEDDAHSDSDADDQSCTQNEPLEKRVRAVNHGDLFRSDRGGAAIGSGDDGYDEEMGGQTQAAYEIYENVKDGLVLEEGPGGNDDNAVVDDKSTVDIRKKNGNGIDEGSSPSARMKSDSLKIGDNTYPTPEKLVLQSHSKQVQTRPDTHGASGASRASSAIVKSKETSTPRDIERPGRGSPEVDCDTAFSPMSQHIPSDHSKEHTNASNDSFKTSPVKIPVHHAQSKNKVLLMGCSDIQNAKTVLSMANIRRPNYAKKKRKKRKSK